MNNLTIELVPKPSWYSNVRSNVPRTRWDKLRKACYAQANHKCEICGDIGNKWPVECHEIWDYDEEQKIQKLTGLISLCPACHQVKHIGLAQIRGKYTEARKHLSIINNITIDEADRYISESFNVWQERSKYIWELDITWLDNDT